MARGEALLRLTVLEKDTDMSIGKELFMQAHERAIAEYEEAHPDADWTEAYEATGERAMEIQRDMVADMIDQAKNEAKDRGVRRGG